MGEINVQLDSVSKLYEVRGGNGEKKKPHLMSNMDSEMASQHSSEYTVAIVL